MERPIKLLFGGPEPKPVDITGNLQGKAIHHLRYAKAEVYKIPQGSVLCQYYSTFLVFMEMYQFNLSDELSAGFEVCYPAIFLFIDILGNIRFSTIEDLPIYHATKGTYYATYNLSGKYGFHTTAGTHLMLCITPRLEWLIKGLDDYPNFREFVNNANSGNARYVHLPRSIIEDHVQLVLKQLYELNTETARGLRSKVVAGFIRLLDHYHDVLTPDKGKPMRDQTPQEKAIATKAYIDLHFTETNIENLTKLAERVNFSEKTLTRTFSKAFNTTIHQYIEELRMAYALKLLHETKLSIKEIAKKTGYHYPSYFTRVFKEHFHKSPQDIRKGL